MSGYVDLTKKNFLIIKSYYPVMFLSAFIIPYVVGQITAKYYGGILPLLMQAAFTLHFAYNQLAFVESKYKSSTFLCITPYARRVQVAAMYITVLCQYCGILFIYFMLSLIPFGYIPSLTFSQVLIVTCMIVIMYSIFIPALYLLGYEKARYAPAICTFIIPYAAVLISKIPFASLNITYLSHLAKRYGLLIACVLAIGFLALSVKLSVKWYNAKEL